MRANELTFLFDVDNTLLNNDRVQADLSTHIGTEYGPHARDRYFEIFERLRDELGYADYLGALERYRLEDLHDPRLLRMSNWLANYPFARRLYPHAIEVVKRAKTWGRTVILSDGDAVFQPRKVECSGLWRIFGGHVLIYVHKEKALADIERMYPAKHYVIVDDKPRILGTIKRKWKDRVTTVFPQQGHYANDDEVLAEYPPADITLSRIGDLLKYRRAAFLGA